MTDTFVQAKHFTPTSGRQIDLVVIHDMEAKEDITTAENVAKWFAGKDAPRASAHWNHDPDSSVRSVLDKDVAWGAPGANHNGLQHELAGYARQTREEWLDDPSMKIMQRAAAKVREECLAYDIPVEFVNADRLLAGARGITTHLEVTRAWHRSTHWDPGYNFPMEDVFIPMVLDHKIKDPVVAPQSHVAGTDDLLSVGSTGDVVLEWEKILVAAGYKIKADGVFDEETDKATRSYQGKLGVKKDGVVGPVTRAAFAKVLAYVAAVSRNKKTFSKSYPPFPGLSKRGSKGPKVTQVQERLRDRGWKIAVDGKFGQETEGIVRSFQMEKGLKVDGEVGPVTWDALWLSPIT